MATLIKAPNFTKNLAEKVHNLSTDQLKVALTNTSPASANLLADIIEVDYTNLPGSRNLTTSSTTQASGVYTLILADLELKAFGTLGPFRYVVVYNDTTAGKNILGYYDIGKSVTLASNEKLVIDFNQTAGALTIS